MFSMKDALEAEREAKQQRLNAARWLRVDESKIASASDLMLLHRVKAAAAERAEVFNKLLQDRDVNCLFNAGALSFSPA